MIKIAPSILSADFSRLGEQIRQLEEGGADMIHLDIMDGHFVPNITFGPPVIKKLRNLTKLPFDVHLMIERPEMYIEEFAKSGADIITIHQEASIHLHRTIQQIKEYGVKAGIALNPSTPLETIKYLLDDIDMILIMTVNPGFGGQTYIKQMSHKIKELKKLISSQARKIDIQVDGGIKLDNIEEVIECGANIAVVGSAIFNKSNITEETKKFKNI